MRPMYPFLLMYGSTFTFLLIGAFVTVDVASSTNVADEDDGLNSLEICLLLEGFAGTDEIQNDVIVPLFIVNGKAGMLKLGWWI